MSFLTDGELKRLLQHDDPNALIIGLDVREKIDERDSQIQPNSVDLRIDEIYLPFESNKEDDPERVRRTSKHTLKVGQSVRISTKEAFNLSNQYGGIIFAPGRISRRGIVVPDIGHIDPGFKGKLILTLINMGRTEYELKEGEKLVTLLLYKLGNAVVKDYEQRNPEESPFEKRVADTRHLAYDFLNLEATAEKVAKKQALRAIKEHQSDFDMRKLLIPLLVAIISGLSPYFFAVRGAVEELKAKVESISITQELKDEIDLLRPELEKLRSDIETIRSEQNQKSP